MQSALRLPRRRPCRSYAVLRAIVFAPCPAKTILEIIRMTVIALPNKVAVENENKLEGYMMLDLPPTNSTNSRTLPMVHPGLHGQGGNNTPSLYP